MPTIGELLKQSPERKPVPAAPRPFVAPTAEQPAPYTGTPDEPLEANPLLNPLELLVMALSPVGPGIKAGMAGKSVMGAARSAALAGSAQAVGQGVGGDIAEGENPLPGILPNAAVGAALGGVMGAGAAGLGRRLRSGRLRDIRAERAGKAAARASAASTRAVESGPVVGPTERGVLPIPEPSGESAPVRLSAAPEPVPARQPLTGETAQQTPLIEDWTASVRSDPDFLQRIDALGGGRVRTNAETLARAVNEGPMSPDELAAWTPDKPVNEVIQTRGLLTFDHYQQKMVKALMSGKADEVKAAAEVLNRLLPGVQNLRAVGGRTTQAQAMFVQDRMTKAVTELADMQQKGVPFEQFEAAVKQKVADLKRLEGWEQFAGRFGKAVNALETYATAAKLTSPVTHAVNSVANALNFAIVRPLETAGRSAALLAQRRPEEARAAIASTFGTTRGLQTGFERMVRTFADPDADLGKGAEAATVRIPERFKYVDPFRYLAAADAFWRGILEDATLNEKALGSALKEGLKGRALAERVTALVNDPPADWRKSAEAVAREFTFQDAPDRFLQNVGRLRNIPGVRLFIPFIQTPYNLARYQFQRSPQGIISPRNIRGLLSGGDAQAESVGRLSAGMGLALGAMAVVRNAEVTGDYPSDPRERALWEAEGRQPWSIKIGGKWVNYNRFSPIGLYIGQAKTLADMADAGRDEEASPLAAQFLAASAKQVFEMPFMSGLSDALDALKDPERSAKRFVSGLATGMVPNVLRDVRNQTDPVRRRTEGTVSSVQNMLPGASQNLPARIDVLGQERRLAANPVQRATKVVTDPTEDAITAALRSARWSPSAPQPRLEPGKGAKPVRLEGRERERFEREMGTATRQALLEVIRDKSFATADRDEQADRMERAVNKARKAVRDRWKAARR